MPPKNNNNNRLVCLLCYINAHGNNYTSLKHYDVTKTLSYCSSNTPALTIDVKERLLKIGSASDLAWCKAMNKFTKNKCKNFINKLVWTSSLTLICFVVNNFDLSLIFFFYLYIYTFLIWTKFYGDCRVYTPSG